VSRAAVFLDRDGTVIEDRDYLRDPGGVRLLPGAGLAIARLTKAAVPVVIVTNQSGIGRGYFSEAEYEAVRERVDALLAAAGGQVLATYHCPHSPAVAPPCDCRKPAPGLFERAARDHDLDLARSSFVGDRLRDLEAGFLAGGRCFLLRGAHDSLNRAIPPTIEVVGSLDQVVERILPGTGQSGVA
jgi:histidinol-phosphate phosphatase family protein